MAENFDVLYKLQNTMRSTEWHSVELLLMTINDYAPLLRTKANCYAGQQLMMEHKEPALDQIPEG